MKFLFHSVAIISLWFGVAQATVPQDTPSHSAPQKLTLLERIQGQDACGKKSIAELEKLTNDPHALNVLGERYFYGTKNIRPDKIKAAKYYHRAADLGSAAAANHLAGSYTRGDGVKVDPKEAEKWCARSIELDPSLENRCFNNGCDNRLLCSVISAALGGDMHAAALDVAEFYTYGTQGFPQDFNSALYYISRVEANLKKDKTVDPTRVVAYSQMIQKLRLEIKKLQEKTDKV